jgi:hypothetical protein
VTRNIWTAETILARHQHYRDLLAAALPPGHHAEPGHQAKWLWRTLGTAELAGQDPARILAAAIAERNPAGARDIPAVLDARISLTVATIVNSALSFVSAACRAMLLCLCPGDSSNIFYLISGPGLEW